MTTVVEAARAYRAALLRFENAAMRRLAAEYGRIYRQLDDQIKAFESLIRLAGLTDDGGDRLARIRAMRSQIEAEVTRFGIWADVETTTRARESMGMGIKAARGKALAYGVPGIEGAFHVLNTDAVEMMLGFLGPASPLHLGLTQRLGPEVALGVEQALIDATALGQNPRMAARAIRRLTREKLGEGLTWAMNTSRTAIIWAEREAERASYVANADLIPSYIRMAAHDGRVCMACVALDGKIFPNTQPLDDHYGGRCTPVPVMRGEPLPDLGISGQAWFEAQDWTFQREMMGPSKYAAWKAGEFDFSQLAMPTIDPVYGQMTIEASLKGILGDRAAQYYRRN